jgi:hypothetical protein
MAEHELAGDIEQVIDGERRMALKIKTFKLFFVFDDEDWLTLSDILQQEFPDGLYFSRDLKRPMLDVYKEESKNWPIRYWSSLEIFQQKNRNSVCTMRDPWPTDLASGADLDLIGGWENSAMNQSEEGFHRHGRCAEFARYRRNVGQQPIATTIDRFGEPAIERIGTLPADAYGDKQFFLHERFSTLRISFNEHEESLKMFAERVRQIMQRLGTRSVALYDPLTDEVLDPSYETGRALIGWQLLRKIHAGELGYLMMPAVFDDVSDWHPKRDGVAGLIGPRPGHPKVKKWAD